MDIKKLVLVMVFFTSGLFLWEEWQAGQHKSTAPQVATTASKGAQGTAGSDSKFEEDGAPVPGEKLVSSQRIKGTGSGEDAAPVAASTGLESGTRITVKTDMVLAVIDTAGGDIRDLDLLNHPSRADKSIPFALLQSEFPRVNVAQSGLIGEGLPTHQTHYTTESESYMLAAGEDKIEIRLSAPEV